jgi:outer membrane murein-binding lipoprotein Lpp
MPGTEVEKALNAAQSAFENKQAELLLAAKVEQLNGQLTELNGAVEQLRSAFNGFNDKVRHLVNQVNKQASDLYSRYAAMEQSVLAMGKIVSATTSTLIKKGTLTDQEVIETLRQDEDKREEETVKQMVAAGILKLGTTSGPESVLVTREEALGDDGNTKTLTSEYRRIEMAQIQDADPIKGELLGKAAGDTVVAKLQDKVSRFTIKAVYDYVDACALSEERAQAGNENK